MANFQTAYNLQTGQRISAGLVNTWIKNSHYLHDLASRTHDVFTGVIINTDSNYYQFVRDVWFGYFVYDGVDSFQCFAASINGILEIWVTDNATETLILSLNSGVTWSGALDISGYALDFTVGTQYQIRVTAQWNGATTSVHLDCLAIEYSNAYSWPTLVAWGVAVNTATDFATINTAQNYLREEIEVPTGSSILQAATVTTNLICNGGFFMRGKGTTRQVTLSITYLFTVGATVTLKTYAGASETVIDTFTEASLTLDGVLHTTPLTLTNGSYTIDGFYRYSITVGSSGDQPTNNYISTLTLGDYIAFSNTAQPKAVGDTLDSVPLKALAGTSSAENANEIRILARGTGSDKGFMWVTPKAIGSLGILTGYFSLGNPTINAAGTPTTYALPSFVRLHIFRYLWYLPTAAGESGTATYATPMQTLALPDNSGTGAWQYVDLESVTTLAYGMTLTISGIAACYEAV